MKITFYKYEGTGNDFILIDNREKWFPKNNITLVHKLCDRHFGIGADGLILLENDAETDFKMTYYNADGNKSTMCGNGGRCIVAFAFKLGVISEKTTFTAIDGLHHANIENKLVSLQMIDVNKVDVYDTYAFVNTGSPHHVQLVENLDNYDVVVNGRKIRNEYGVEGSNINFVQQINESTFKVRTYERGVEDETLACGTGVTAVAIAMHKINKTQSNNITLPVLGGELEVSFNVEKNQYKNVFLKGPATFVFKGVINIDHIDA
ncbi:Diaminopimelate epimerase [Polaribacter huanghezhanensis]|uniref:diaminopimelate epimerase n=1 Tax=Polaribacter huanghezhanensis TaxID=1354726 RepID=UPI002649D947|nr:diaminopimelate epimerase [Polaribacter huanghezhanensis]WKD87051.1 Diaminopimelate epimerase [Polaribacter huanghezhanensis]